MSESEEGDLKDGKEGVDGSSPSESLREVPAEGVEAWVDGGEHLTDVVQVAAFPASSCVGPGLRTMSQQRVRSRASKRRRRAAARVPALKQDAYCRWRGVRAITKNRALRLGH
jgi:hypothetical protein